MIIKKIDNKKLLEDLDGKEVFDVFEEIKMQTPKGDIVDVINKVATYDVETLTNQIDGLSKQINLFINKKTSLENILLEITKLNNEVK